MIVGSREARHDDRNRCRDLCAALRRRRAGRANPLAFRFGRGRRAGDAGVVGQRHGHRNSRAVVRRAACADDRLSHPGWNGVRSGLPGGGLSDSLGDPGRDRVLRRSPEGGPPGGGAQRSGEASGRQRQARPPNRRKQARPLKIRQSWQARRHPMPPSSFGSAASSHRPYRRRASPS